MNPVPSTRGFNINRIIKIVSIFIPLALAVNIVYALLATDFSIIQGLGNYSILYLSLAIALAFVPWIAHTLRIFIWGRAFGKNLTFGESFRTAIATDLGAAITPSAIGGSYAKLGILASFGFSPGEATLVTLLGTIEDATFFIFAIPLAFFITGAWNDPGIRQVANNLTSSWLLIVGIGAAVIIAYFLIVKLRRRNNPKIQDLDSNKPASILNGLRIRLSLYKGQFVGALGFVAQNHIATFLLCALLAGVGWICRYSVITFLILGLGYPVDPILFFLLQWVVFTLMTLFPTPGAIGGAEVSLALIFKAVVPSGVIPILTGAWRFLTFYLIMITGAAILIIFGVGRSNCRYRMVERDVSEEISAV